MTRTFFSVLAILLLVSWTTNAYSQKTDDKEQTVEKADKADDKEDTVPKQDKDEKAEPQEAEIKPLTIGSVAPGLDIEHWVQDGDGEFGVVTDFEKNKVYVVEFWATWCGPCIGSMPHIVEMQEKYADRDVQIVSISDEDLETVEKFLDREVRGSEDGATYRDLTRAYCLTTDPDRSSERDYMRAAGQNGIPCAFVVGKQGRIEWIGHPMSMDDVLEQVVNDDWDREAFAEEFIAEQEADAVLARVSRAMRSRDIDKAIELLDEYIAEGKLELQRNRFKLIKFQILASSDDFADRAADHALELLADKSHDAASANNLVWTIYQMARAGRYEDERVTKAALKLAKRKVKEAGELRAFLLDTVAHLQHLTGDSEQALKTQRRAVKVAKPDQKQRLEGFLKELQEALEPKEEEKPDAKEEKSSKQKDDGDADDDDDDDDDEDE